MGYWRVLYYGLFSVFSSDLKVIECTLGVENTKLGRPADVLEGRTVIQRDLNRLEEWAVGTL